MGFPRLLIVTAIFGMSQIAWTQSPSYGLGRRPSAEEIRAWDIAISPTGKELPPGQGTAKEGAVLYVRDARDATAQPDPEATLPRW